MLDLRCKGTKIELDLSGEKLSMLIVGGSRMGKTYFMSLLGNYLVQKEEVVHFIDLGYKWSQEDKKRIGIPATMPETDSLQIYFPSKSSLIDSAGYIASAMGYRSVEVIRIIRAAMERAILQRKEEGFSIEEFIRELEAEHDPEAAKISGRLAFFGDMSKIELLINMQQSEKMAYSNTIWDLSGYETDFVKMLFQFIILSVLSTQKIKFRRHEQEKRVFFMVDEFQNLDCNKQSIIGTCLREGQKYKTYLVLATQFLQGEYSEAVINQFKQGGFQMYFRLTEEEAGGIGRQLAYNRELQKEWIRILCTIKQGQFVLRGPHRITGANSSTDQIRIVDVKAEVKKSGNILTNSGQCRLNQPLRLGQYYEGRKCTRTEFDERERR